MRHTRASARHDPGVPTESAKTVVEHPFSRTRGDDQPISELARRQHGVVGRWQLIEDGWTEEEVKWRLRTGRLHRVHAGVYSLGPPQLLSRQGRWMASVLASGPGALLSHWSAAALWQVRPNSKSQIDVTVAHSSRSSKAICRHVSHVPSDERAVEEGIPATSVHRTIFDLASTVSVDEVVAMIKEAEYLNRWDRLSLRNLLDRYPGRRGSRKVRYALRRLKEEPPGRRRSKLEDRFAPFLRRHRLPLPRFNDLISLNGRTTKSTATGRSPVRSSSSMVGRATAPARPSAKTAPATVPCTSPAIRSPISPGTSWTTNRRRSPRIFGCCWPKPRSGARCGRPTAWDSRACRTSPSGCSAATGRAGRRRIRGSG